MDELAWPLALVAHDGRTRNESRQPAQPPPAQHDADRGERPAELAGNERAAQALAAQRDDLVFGRIAQPGGAVVRPGGAIHQARLALGGEAGAPLAHRIDADAVRRGHAGHAPAARQALHHQHSTMPRRAGILMDVHPGLREGGCVCGNHNLPPKPRMDNLHSSDT